MGRPWTASRNSSPNDLNADCRPREARAVRRWTAAGMTRMNKAAASMIAATGKSHQAMKAKIATGAQMAMATWGRYWPKKVCNCSTPSTIDSITPPVRSAPNQAGPRAVIWSNRRPRRDCCTSAATRWAIIVRAWSSTPRSRMAAAAPPSGQASVAAGSPRNTPAMNRPRKAKRAIPTPRASRPRMTEDTIRPRMPRVMLHSFRSKCMGSAGRGVSAGMMARVRRRAQAVSGGGRGDRRRLLPAIRHIYLTEAGGLAPRPST